MAASYVDRVRPVAGPVARAVRGRGAPPSTGRLAERFARRQTARNLYRLTRGLYRAGELARPDALLSDHPALVAELDEHQRKLVARIQGQAALARRLPTVPARQPNAAMLVEHGRVMYCAHSTPPFQSNGYAMRTRGLVAGIAATGTDVFVAARPGYPWDAGTDTPTDEGTSFTREIDGIAYEFSFGPGLDRQRLDDYLESAVDAYLRSIMLNRPAHVHAASNHQTALPALIAARIAGLPFSYEVRGFWEYGQANGGSAESEQRSLAQELEDLVLAEADHVFVISDQMADELAARGVNRARCSVVPNGVDTDRFQPLPRVGDLADRLGLDRSKTVIGYAGSMVAYEGIDRLIDACTRLGAVRGDFQLLLAGDGPELPRLRQRLERSGARLDYQVTGRLPSDLMPELVGLMDIVVCPRLDTRVTRMVSPLKPLEALACGIPVVVSNLPVLRELVRSSGGGRTVPPDDVDALTATLSELIDDPGARRDLGRSGRLWALDERRWASLGGGLVDVIRALHRVPSMDAAAPGARDLHEISVGIVADEFTTAALAETVQTVALTPEDWQDQLGARRFDAVFVESAWNGNGGRWHRAVGHYSDEESAPLRRLLEQCRASGIPTIFWNKEDPVHFERFAPNALHFDHILTTDNRAMPRYQKLRRAPEQSIGTMPFFAQPRLHHPLSRHVDRDHPVMYAGSYYGDRYAERSRTLGALLDAARPHGLLIHDRQANNPESPYRFPADLQECVAGGLDYAQMLEAYRSHPIHINVNSVTASETMFARRVMEILSTGGLVLSGPSHAVAHLFRGLVPTTGSTAEAAKYLEDWLRAPDARNVAGWNGRRLVRRSHTLGHRLTIALRLAGLRVRAPELPRVDLRLTGGAEEAAWEDLLSQTLPPASVAVDGPMPERAAELLEARGVRVSRDGAVPAPDPGPVLQGQWNGSRLDRTVLEDLVTLLVDTGGVGATLDDTRPEDSYEPLAYAGDAPASSVRLGTSGPNQVVMRRGMLGIERSAPDAEAERPAAHHGPTRAGAGRRIVVAGHDFKFAGGLISALEAQGHEVRLDPWQGHNEHDENTSTDLSEWADLVFCEWGLGNAVWYSRNKRPGQRLVVRIHSQELFTQSLSRMDAAAVDHFVFVAAHIRDAAMRFRGIADRPSTLVPNMVAVPDRRGPKPESSRFVLGLVGIVPRQKGLDRALDLLASLRERDNRYTLRIKGKHPRDYPWMEDRPGEKAFYERQFARWIDDPRLRGAVHFDGYSADQDDLGRWYDGVGFAVSVSDFESFHYTLADGAARRAVPVSLAWTGAERIYPRGWIHASTNDMARRILALGDTEAWRAEGEAARAYVAARFDAPTVADRLVRVIVAGPSI
ncbi:glycosyltransferase [Arthrobacter sp. KK5.5]|uniref:glycosyltransferase n=1 Tax=Arthrobacter sp. KK5.5 TaxID=3373084 RepID=UPI003EE469CF